MDMLLEAHNVPRLNQEEIENPIMSKKTELKNKNKKTPTPQSEISGTR